MDQQQTPFATVARRIIPWFLVNYVLMPLAYVLILIGYGTEVASEFKQEMM
jgi:hypothetical protein